MIHRHGLAGVSIIVLGLLYLVYRGLEGLYLSFVCRGTLVRGLITWLATYTIVGLFAVLSSRGASGVQMLISPCSRRRDCLVNDEIKALWRF